MYIGRIVVAYLLMTCDFSISWRKAELSNIEDNTNGCCELVNKEKHMKKETLKLKTYLYPDFCFAHYFSLAPEN